MITIEKALDKIPFYKAEYFKWKFNINFTTDRSTITEEEFLKRVNRTNIKVFERWERTEEYRALVDIYLHSRSANDLLDVYEVVIAKAKEGDTKSIEQMLKLQKEIKDNAKYADKNINKIIQNSKQKKSNRKYDEEDDDGLII
ncbi:MAG: hypothetical protein PHY33_07650 [Methanobacteriaceae archaeon]|nr:hypothetical protein [Methanobacteriaceae archaeon]